MALPDVRIVIVSWNVEKLLQRCLASLPEACHGLAYEVVVVDNASADGSVTVARAAGATVIENPDNRGFAKACNQGMAGSPARYVLLLNPDTECPPGALTQLVQEADRHPRAGIVGPKLLNTDGSTQQSVRRFPTVWSQAGVMLKLHNLFPWAFRRYFAADVSPNVEQDVDQVMGACFLIRRECLNDIGGLDERYFIWFEEVDYCRTARQRGWMARYLPSVAVTHHGGQSFAQVFALNKQRYFNESMMTYFQKWHPAWQARLLRALQPMSLALAWGVGKLPYTAWIIAVLAIEVLSRATIFHDTANGLATITVGLIVAILTFKRPTLGLAVLALELLIGSHGRLLQLWGWPGAVSLRMMLFMAFGVGWGARAWWHVGLKRIITERWEWVLLAAALAYGVVVGIARGNPAVVADANAWVYALLLIPVIHLARTQKERLRADVLPVLVLGPLWLAAKAIGLEYLFAHGMAVVDPPTETYLWIRRIGGGEITPLTPVIHRVFMQSQVFALPALLLSASYYFTTHDKAFSRQHNRIMNWLLLAAVIALIIGYSRSLWIGAAAGLALLVALHVRGIKTSISIAWTAVRGAVAVFATLAILAIAITFPIPAAPSLTNTGAVAERIGTTDAAASSRWELLTAMKQAIQERPLAGYGVGATLTYQSADPRVRAQNPDGMYTTFAFEWGWLDHWFKMGVFGVLAIVTLLVRIGIRILRTPAEPWVKYGLFASLLALAATHFFTPYLNHPLGIGYLLMIEGWSEWKRAV